MTEPMERAADLIACLDRHDRLTIAVSGGVDSMVLAYIAHRFSRAGIIVAHAVSPAVPTVATARVDHYAERYNWHLIKIDAGEMADDNYLSNPVDRCFYCKQDLYSSVAARIPGTIASGTNVDDLSDFRPGLVAAKKLGVIHPFVEAGLHKHDIYALADVFELRDLAALPAQPCLASRIETGLAIDPTALSFIETVEAELAAALPATTSLRCRITHAGILIELEPIPDDMRRTDIIARAERACSNAGRVFIGIRPYRRGSAFIQTAAEKRVLS